MRQRAGRTNPPDLLETVNRRKIMQGIIVVQVRNQRSELETESREHLMLREIEEEVEHLERVSAEVTMRHAVLSQLHNTIRELLGLSGKPDKTASPENPEVTKTPPESAKPEPAPEPQPVSDPKPKRKQKPKEKAKPEYQRLPRHRVTGNTRLDALETALHDALERLVNTKLAHYVKDINEVRLSLIELYKAWDSPGDERLAELESGLKAAADKLSGNSRAAKSKIMQDIWGDIIVALQNKENNE
jgi:hypothetical protein